MDVVWGEKMEGALELNRIYCCNALDLMARMPDGFIDLTVTSPPYDEMRNYKGYHFDVDPIVKALYRSTAEGGVVVWVVGDQTLNGSESVTSAEHKICFRQAGFYVHDTMIYERTPAYPSNPESVRYSQSFEYMFVFSKGKPKTINLIQDRENKWGGSTSWGQQSERRKNGDLKPRSVIQVRENGVRFNIWNYATGKGQSALDEIAYQHPAIFPEALARDHILSWSNENDLVYDPFMGSGTTAKAAHQLGRRWIGSEISSEYVELANKRLEPYLMQADLFSAKPD